MQKFKDEYEMSSRDNRPREEVLWGYCSYVNELCYSDMQWGIWVVRQLIFYMWQSLAPDQIFVSFISKVIWIIAEVSYATCQSRKMWF